MGVNSVGELASLRDRDLRPYKDSLDDQLLLIVSVLCCRYRGKVYVEGV